MRKPLVLLPALLLTHLPILPPQDWWPVFSPSGRYVAFTQVTGNTMTLEVADLQMHRTVKIAANQGQLAPSWSKADRLAFSLGGKIYTESPNGTARARVTSAEGRSFAPAWRPGSSTQLAYLTTIGAQNTDLWVAGTLWARDAIGRPAWSPDGTTLAFQRDDGIYVTTAPGADRKVASISNPQAPAWSPDGREIAYTAARKIWIVPADGSSAPRALVAVGVIASDPAWVPDGTAVAYTSAGAVWETSLKGVTNRFHAATNAGVSVSSRNGAIAFPGPNPKCPSHGAVLLDTAGHTTTLAGNCT